MTGCYVKAMVPIFCKKKPLNAHHEIHIEGQKRRAAHTTWNAWRTPLGAFYTANQTGQIRLDSRPDKSDRGNQLPGIGFRLGVNYRHGVFREERIGDYVLLSMMDTL